MSDSKNTPNHPSVKALVEHQERLGDSDSVFARRYIRISAASWSLLKAGKYQAADPSKMLERCDNALSILNDQAEKANSTDTLRNKILDLTHVRAAMGAVKMCYGEPQNRLVVFLAPSGGGKSTLARKLSQAYPGAACVVEATENWRNSYFNAMSDVAKDLGIEERYNNPRPLEHAIIDHLKSTMRILVIDEGHYCGPAALNLLKVILNKTTARIVLCAIPELWSRLEAKAYEEVRQLRRRTVAKIVVPEVTRGDARAFLAAKLPGYAHLGDQEKEAIALAVTSANRFGLYDTLQRICTEAREEAGEDAITLELVKAAINRVEALRS